MLLDGKGRMTVPARHREGLKAVCEDRLTITKNPKRCLTIFPRPAWEAFRARLLALPMSVDDWRRVYLGSAMDVEIDASSRVLIPSCANGPASSATCCSSAWVRDSSSGTRPVTTRMKPPCWPPACPTCCATP